MVYCTWEVCDGYGFDKEMSQGGVDKLGADEGRHNRNHPLHFRHQQLRQKLVDEKTNGQVTLRVNLGILWTASQVAGVLSPVNY